MYWYALVGILATAVLIIENFDILFDGKNDRQFPEIETYKKFLYGIIAYYITDVLWSILNSLHLTGLLYFDTLVYYIAMAVGVLFWTGFVVTYLGENNLFSYFLTYAGRFCFVAVVTITIINLFTPILFWFDENGTYYAGIARHIQLIFQILLLLLTSVYTLMAIPHAEGASKKRYRTIFLFGLVVAILLLIQIPYPFLPLYTIGYMLGSSLLHSFVVNNEIDELLKRQSELAIAANKAKSSFLSNMSHEIRTPINAILGMNEMILRENENQNVLTYSENIRTAGNTLLSLVNDILDFSKIEAGKLEIIPVEYDLSSVLSDLVNMIQPRAKEKGLELKLTFNPNTPKHLYGDEIRLKQIITNILTNAVKYTEKGSITFALDYEQKPNLHDSIFLKVSVSDTGIGIKPEDIERLFSKFDRIEEKRNRKIEGTGLGMNISQSLLEMMNSKLEVKSVYGEGSVFSFCLEQQIISWKNLGNYEDSYRAFLSLRKKDNAHFFAPDAQVMMVDDNPMNLTVFKSLLKRTGIKVDTADSGDEGLTLSSKKKYDIIFLDHMMPEKDGIETLHELRARKNDPNRNTPVICLTASAVSGARKQYIDAGFDNYLSKPINPSKLENMIIYYLPDEKIEKKYEADDTVTDQEIPKILQPLLGQDWIDLPSGMNSSSSPEAYIELLRFFYEHFDQLANKLNELYQKEDWKSYIIKVHAIKSSVRLIGANDLANEAQELEDAGKNNDLEYIHENHHVFMTKYLSIKAPLTEIFFKKEDPIKKQKADPDLLETVYEEILSAAEEMDIERIESVIREISEYSIPESENSLWEDLMEAVKRYEYNRITELLKEKTG
ncbi:MAG: response regulator [Lachnospiraceae bacterium]|nr:response regulator [Lachnospiraceae bacterium]